MLRSQQLARPGARMGMGAHQPLPRLVSATGRTRLTIVAGDSFKNFFDKMKGGGGSGGAGKEDAARKAIQASRALNAEGGPASFRLRDQQQKLTMGRAALLHGALNAWEDLRIVHLHAWAAGWVQGALGRYLLLRPASGTACNM